MNSIQYLDTPTAAGNGRHPRPTRASPRPTQPHPHPSSLPSAAHDMWGELVHSGRLPTFSRAFTDLGAAGLGGALFGDPKPLRPRPALTLPEEGPIV